MLLDEVSIGFEYIYIILIEERKKLKLLKMTKLGLEPLYYRRRTHILRFVDECIANRVPRYLSNYFNVRNRDIHRHKTRNNNDLILEKINLECTKRAFFYKGAKIFNNF